MTKFRQQIRPGDKGLDVLAVKRALRRLGYGRGLILGYVAGPRLVEDIRFYQKTKHLNVTGVYGEKTHQRLAPSFDGFGNWLYTHAKIRPRSVYVNPFARAAIQTGRIDQGVDFHGHGPIDAIGDAHIVGRGGAGWPGGQYLLYRLLAGEHAGRFVYVAEAIHPLVLPGARVKAGQPIATFGADAAPGRFPGIETGWGSPTVNLTLAAAMGNTGGPGHSDSPAGLAFARFLHSLGVAGLNVGPGPTYP